MPITVACSCGAKLRAPDAAAGKRVKCPKCASPVPVPAAEADFEVIDDDPPPAPVKKKPTVAAAVKRKPEPVEVDEPVDDEDDDEKPKKKKSRRRDDDEDEDDDKPKKKGGKRKVMGKNREEEKKKRMIRLILGIVGALTVLGVMVGVIVAVMNVINNDPAKTGLPAQPTGPTPPPSGWKTFKAGGMSVWIPESVTLTERMQEAGENPAVTSAKSWTNFDPKNPPQGAVAIYEIGRGQLQPAFADKFRQDPTAAWEELLKKTNAGAAPGVQITTTDGTLGGERGKQIVIQLQQNVRVTSRSVVKGGEMYTASVLSKGAGDDDPVVKNFFDGFRFE